MPKYTVSNLNPQTKFCEIAAVFQTNQQSVIELSIPRWRPARYSLQNYAELIQEIKFLDENGQFLPYTKLNQDTWIIQTHNLKEVKVCYNFYANQFEAGGSFIDEDFILINPINCLMYDKNALDQECSLEILAEDFDIIQDVSFRGNREILADSKEKISHHVRNDIGVKVPLSRGQAGRSLGVVNFPDYHQLVDTPLLLVKKDSTKFKKIDFEVKDLENGKIDIEIVIYGENKLDLAKVESDFKTFISEQVKVFKTFAVKNYTFLCILPDFPAYHGVEHQHSSVNIFGEGFTIHKTENYKQFLGLCCHEFFHHWNIKSIRPKELIEYDYSKEQLFITGYVAEGFTTYYGDLILYRAGLITLEDLAKIFSRAATSHIQNFGRFKSSMHESSLDLWLDGYKVGIPDDKINIYTEGCLLALILDARIQKESGQLDRLLYKMFERFGNLQNGYTEHDLIELCREITAKDFAGFFRDFYASKVDLISTLSESLDFLGLRLEIKNSPKSYEADFGIKINPNGDKLEITKIYPSSSSYQKLSLSDQLMTINGKSVNPRNFEAWFDYFENQETRVQVLRKGQIIDIILNPDPANGLKIVEISPIEKSD